MKIDRQIGILSVLLQREHATAPELAEMFEVSRRTINRDIDDLCRAGIPLVTLQGSGGGISIAEGYRLDRTLLTEADMRAILEGIASLDSVSAGSRYRQLTEKLTAGRTDALAADKNILIDLSAWSREAIVPKIELIRHAIDAREKLRIEYSGPSGDSTRTVEPCLLIFKWSAWYLWAWCAARSDFRLFRLSRIRKISPSGDHFPPREVPEPLARASALFPTEFTVTAVFRPEVKWRLIDTYGDGCYTVRPDGSLLFSMGFTNRDHALEWLLSFGAQVEVIEPAVLRREIASVAEKMSALYRET